MKAIETTKLTKRYKDKTAVDALNLTIGQGELFALLGVNGAGKCSPACYGPVAATRS